jgi:hypothetical protein
MLAVAPLGPFGVVAHQQEFALFRDELLSLRDKVPSHERQALAQYLRSATIVFAIMEHSRDVIDAAFESPGGSAVMTDGSYYWRLDAADYVAHYGIGLPVEFLQRRRGSNWKTCCVPPADAIRIDRYLLAHARRIPRGEKGLERSSERFETSLSGDALQALISRYALAAAMHGHATEKGDFVAGNQAHETVASVYRELRRRGITAQRVLLPLLVHHEPGVRGWAASHALEFAATEGEAVLIAMSDVPKSKVSFSARMTLREWRAGRPRFP